MENNVTGLFVYGSLRSGSHHPAHAFVSRYFNLVSEAKVRGRLYDIGSFPAALPTTDMAYVVGELYELNLAEDFSKAIMQLDDYEEVNNDAGKPQLYKRELTEVLYNNHSATAWIYWYNQNITDEPIISSGDVLDLIHQKSKL